MLTSRMPTERFALVRISLLFAFALLATSALFFPASAWAEVRKADVISGLTVEQRDLAVAGCPSVDAEYAVLIDADGEQLFGRNAESPSQIASLTKVMTAIVVVENADENTKVTVSEAAASIGESTAGLQAGDVMDLDAALKALLVPSGNDAALALAETVGEQIMAKDASAGTNAVGAFVQYMNKKAQEIGCTDTVYENPHGLDDGEFAGNLHSTAADQALVAKYAMGIEKIRAIVSGGSTKIPVDRAGAVEGVELETTDELLEMYEYTIGVKTGVTDLAGPSFMGAANKDGRELYAVVLGSTDEMQRFADTKALFVWAYDHVRDINLANSERETVMSMGGQDQTVPVIAAASHADWTDKTVPATLADPQATISVFDLEGNVSQSVSFEELHGTVHVGDKVGSIVFKQRNQVVAEQDLVACETVEGPNPIESIGIAWNRLIGGFSGAPSQAESEIYSVMPIIASNVSNAA